ncbi:MAG TPA: hypothetical protein VFS30_18335 [Dehalococcoidia bacterium]|nr:hypothetical protein [Dehalococcoidia bacterium]
MKLVSTYGHNWKRTNVQLVSLACGLALASAVIAGGYEVLRDKDTTVVISRVAQPAGLGIESALQPQFGSAADAVYAAQSFGTEQAAVSLGEALGIGQPGEGVKSVEATLIDPTDLSSLGIESALQPQFGSMADADFAAIGLAYVRSAQSSATVLGDALGIGQPGEGTQSVAATLIDPTDFASSFANHRAAQQFGTAADAAYATESWQARASEAPLFGTMVDAVYVMEGEIQIP